MRAVGTKAVKMYVHCTVGRSELALFVIFKMDTLLSIRCTVFLGVEFQKISKLAHVSCMAKVLFF